MCGRGTTDSVPNKSHQRAGWPRQLFRSSPFLASRRDGADVTLRPEAENLQRRMPIRRDGPAWPAGKCCPYPLPDFGEAEAGRPRNNRGHRRHRRRLGIQHNVPEVPKSVHIVAFTHGFLPLFSHASQKPENPEVPGLLPAVSLPAQDAAQIASPFRSPTPVESPPMRCGPVSQAR